MGITTKCLVSIFYSLKSVRFYGILNISMISLKKKILAGLFLVAISATLGVVYINDLNHNLSHELNKTGVNIAGIENFRIQDNSEKYIYATHNDEVIKININDEGDAGSAASYINNEVALFLGIFQPHLPPYPEFLTREASCPDNYKPSPQKTSYGRSFTLYAGERFGYGVCVDDLIKYRASINYFYCPNLGKVFKIEYFINKTENMNKLLNFIDSFTCSK